MQVTDVGEVETLDLKASILLFLNALEILAGLFVLAIEGNEAVLRVGLAPRLPTSEQGKDDFAPHADDTLGDANAPALERLGVREAHSAGVGGNLVVGEVGCSGVAHNENKVSRGAE